jgi:hypothetical protein
VLGVLPKHGHDLGHGVGELHEVVGVGVVGRAGQDDGLEEPLAERLVDHGVEVGARLNRLGIDAHCCLHALWTRREDDCDSGRPEVGARGGAGATQGTGANKPEMREPLPPVARRPGTRSARCSGRQPIWRKPLAAREDNPSGGNCSPLGKTAHLGENGARPCPHGSPETDHPERRAHRDTIRKHPPRLGHDAGIGSHGLVRQRLRPAGAGSDRLERLVSDHPEWKENDEARTRGWAVVSMKSDWKRIFSFGP